MAKKNKSKSVNRGDAQAEPPWKKDEDGEDLDTERDEDEDEDEDEYEDEDEDDGAVDQDSEEDEEVEDGEDAPDDEEEEYEDDEEDEDEYEDEDEDEPSARRPVHADPSDDGLPDWLPWVVMIGLIAVGAMGAAGFFSPKTSKADDTVTSSTETKEVDTTDKPASISAQHLLVQYQGSARAGSHIKRTKAEAKTRAEEALKKAKSGADFDKLAAEYSDEPGAKTGFGKLGKFTPERMVKPFSDAAFALKVGGISGIVETPFGYHVIKRTE